MTATTTNTIIDRLEKGDIIKAIELLYRHINNLSEEDKDKILQKALLDCTTEQTRALHQAEVTRFFDEGNFQDYLLTIIRFEGKSTPMTVEEARKQCPNTFEVNMTERLIPFQHKHLCYLLDHYNQASEQGSKVLLLLKDVQPNAYNLVQAIRSENVDLYNVLVIRVPGRDFMTDYVQDDADKSAITFIQRMLPSIGK
jgi:hypothetical protein